MHSATRAATPLGLFLLLTLAGTCEKDGPPAQAGGGTPIPGNPASGLTERPSNATCVAPARPTSIAKLELERVFPTLSFNSTTGLGQPPGERRRWWLAQQPGRVLLVDARGA